MRVPCRSNSPPEYAQARPVRGFTLVELAVTLVVLSVLIAIAAPLFTGVSNGNKLTSNANEFVAAMQIARSEAIRLNARTTFCQSNDGATCTNTSTWQGWLVFSDADRDGAVDADEIVRTGTIKVPMQVLPSNNIASNRVVFRADGLAYAGNNLLEANIRVCLPVTNPEQNARDVNIAIGGRINVKAPINGAGSCARPGDT